MDGLVRRRGRTSAICSRASAAAAISTCLLAAFLGRPRASAAPTGPPLLPLPDAVRLAEEWVREHGVDLSGQHLDSARLRWDDGPDHKGRYWHLQWAWSVPRLGGEFGARVYMNGSVVSQRCGP